MTDGQRDAIMLRFQDTVLSSLDRIESDLAEIKARLAYASPGYDMDKPGTLEEYEALADNWRSGRVKQEEGR